ncbi:hypothetical protein Dimus_008054, partial [Dionaea muscipula]
MGKGQADFGHDSSRCASGGGSRQPMDLGMSDSRARVPAAAHVLAPEVPCSGSGTSLRSGVTPDLPTCSVSQHLDHEERATWDPEWIRVGSRRGFRGRTSVRGDRDSGARSVTPRGALRVDGEAMLPSRDREMGRADYLSPPHLLSDEQFYCVEYSWFESGPSMEGGQVFERMFRGWSLIHNYSHDPNGRVWRDLVFEASFVYARNDYSLRISLWDSIVHIADSARQTPLVILGDFNVIRALEEKTGGGAAPRGMREFSQCLLRAGLEDLRYAGLQFGPTTSRVLAMLRLRSTGSWSMMSGCGGFLILGPSFSPRGAQTMPRVLLLKESLVQGDFGHPSFTVCRKLKLLKIKFRRMNESRFSDVSKWVRDQR